MSTKGTANFDGVEVRIRTRHGVTAIVDPRYRCGRAFSPVGPGVIFYVLMGHIKAGDSPQEVADWYCIPLAEVWKAITWYSGIPNLRELAHQPQEAGNG